MPIFKSSEELQKVLGSFFDKLIRDPIIGAKLKASKLIIRFNYKNPGLSITANCSLLEIGLSYNDTETKPEVEMFMEADVAHKFWLGKINLPLAIARRQMIAKGPIPKILKLLPVIKPAYKLYEEHIKELKLEPVS